MKEMKILHIVGARPQFIKASALCRAIAKHNREKKARGGTGLIQEVILHTGQHYHELMSDVFFEQLSLPRPHYNLGVGSRGHGEQTGLMLKRLEKPLKEERPDWVLVYGDTNSALAGALGAAQMQMPLAHVEAGLRSYNRKMPEELNRVVIDHISDLLFCPSAQAVENLKREGITRGVYQVGDVMLDSLLASLEQARKHSNLLETLKLKPKGYFLATLHRQENTDDRGRLETLLDGLAEMAEIEEAQVVFPLHPRTRNRLGRGLKRWAYRLFFLDPLPYLEMLLLESLSKAILTDSGGVQKEAYYFMVPCITLREETEWQETVQSGWNILVGYETERLLMAVKTVVSGQWSVGERDEFYGDGRASERVVEILMKEARSQ